MTPNLPSEKLTATPIHTASASKRYSSPSARDGWQDFIQVAKRQFREAEEGWSEIRKMSLEDLKFYWGQQWPANIEADRTNTNRPCLTFNHMKAFVAQVANEERQTRPAIQINPVGDGADIETADVVQGLVRHIEQISDAECAYDKAFEDATIMGFGFFRLRTDYLDEDSLDQEIFVEMIPDAFKVYLDPTAKKRDRSDARYAFIVSDLTQDQFKAEYPNAQFSSLNDFRSIGDSEAGWYTSATIRVVEYYRVVITSQVLVRLTNGKTVALPDGLKDSDTLELDERGMPITRKSQKRQIKWCKMTAAEKLAEKDVPGKIIPIIMVAGREATIDGKLQLEGMVRDVKDAQRAYNFDRTAIVETNNLVPKAPWMATPEQIEGHEQMYQQSNIRNIAVLYHNTVRDAAGNPLPPPQRVNAAPAIQHLVAATQLDTQDMQAITGLHAPSLGEASANRSGKAVEALQREGDTANFNFADNLKTAIRLAGLIMVDWIPVVYDVPRAQRIVNPDGTHKVVMLNHPFVENGVPKLYDMSTGRYDVTVQVGPSFSSRRQEFVQSVLSLAQAAPQLIGFIADLLVRNMDWPGANEIADRLKKMLPPQLQDGGEDGKQPPIPPQVQAQVQQLVEQHAILTAQLNKATGIISSKTLELESKERIAAMQARVQLLVAELKARTDESNAMRQHDFKAVEHELDLIDRQSDRAGQAQAAQDDQQHQQAMQGADQQHQQGMQAADQQHQQGMQQAQLGAQPAPASPQGK